MKKYIDLRSDTVTKPTPEMWEAMANAKVGDDVYGDDPTANELQAYAAELTGKEASLFVPSGTMGNMASILVHCQRGDEAIVGYQSHVFLEEAGGMSVLGGIHPYPLANQPDGTLDLDQIEFAIRDKEDIHFPISSLICLENTQAECGGVPIRPEYFDKVKNLADKYGLKVHLDGARLFNAAVALDVDVKELTRSLDSLTFCLSKGLSAPIGSMICGSKEFIKKVVRIRKLLGAGMRQVGVVAAAGLVALQNNIDRLKEDHENLKVLVEGIRNIPQLSIDFDDQPMTNMVFVTINPSAGIDSAQLVDRLESNGVLCNPVGKNRIRLLTHYWIKREDIDTAIKALQLSLE